jgi:pimeloyl-ACP methyl ester carboxylesterase
MEYPSRWKQRNALLGSRDDVRLHYIDCPPLHDTAYEGTVLLIHGFPQTYSPFQACNPRSARC